MRSRRQRHAAYPDIDGIVAMAQSTGAEAILANIGDTVESKDLLLTLRT